MRTIFLIILMVSALSGAAANSRRLPNHHTIFMPDKVIVVTTDGSQQRGLGWYAINPQKREFTYLEFLEYFADNWLVHYDMHSLAYMATFWPGQATVE